jgi:hypothetical protein
MGVVKFEKHLSRENIFVSGEHLIDKPSEYGKPFRKSPGKTVFFMRKNILYSRQGLFEFGIRLMHHENGLSGKVRQNGRWQLKLQRELDGPSKDATKNIATTFI